MTDRAHCNVASNGSAPRAAAAAGQGLLSPDTSATGRTALFTRHTGMYLKRSLLAICLPRYYFQTLAEERLGELMLKSAGRLGTVRLSGGFLHPGAFFRGVHKSLDSLFLPLLHLPHLPAILMKMMTNNLRVALCVKSFRNESLFFSGD